MQSRRYPSICRCQLLAAARGPCGMHRIRDERSSGTNCCSLSPQPCKLLLLINVSMGKMRLRRALPKSRCPNPAHPPCHRPPRPVGAVAVAKVPGKKSAPARPNSEWRPNRRKAAPNRRKSVKNVGNFGRSNRLVKAVACACISPWAQHAERPGDRMPR